MKKIAFVIIFFLTLFLLGLNYSSKHHGEEHELHLLEKIRQHQTPLSYHQSSTNILDTASFIEVHADLPEVASFFTEKPSLAITSFPCSNCHNQPLAKMQANRDISLQKAHWDIHLVHANESAMNCATCHASNDMNQLTTLTGKMLPIDESFKLCGQCHSTQFKDWQGGAHGKELSGWKPPRVAKTCVSCHNPHQPAFPKRFPARLNTKQLGE